MHDIVMSTVVSMAIILTCEKSISGEFGIVYKGHITTNQGQVVTEIVAIKTLKGMTVTVYIYRLAYNIAVSLTAVCITRLL